MSNRNSRATATPLQPTRRGLFVNRTTVIPHLRIRDAGSDIDSALQHLRTKLMRSGAFYRGLSVVLDFEGFSAPVSTDTFTHLVSQLKSLEIHAMGITNPGSAAVGDAARVVGLPVLSSSSSHTTKPMQPPRVSVTSAAPESDSAESPGSSKAPDTSSSSSSSSPSSSSSSPPRISPSSSSSLLPTVVIDRPLRSGQQFYARGASLVVLGSVNSGSEVVADGDIHVFGPLIGRALAGATGNENARIVTTSFRAELASIASVYRTGDLFPQSIVTKPAVVWLESGQLQYCSFDLILDKKRT